MNEPIQLSKESTRIAVRHHLAERPSVSQDAATIHRHVSRTEVCTARDVQDALTFLEGLDQIESEPEPLGSTLYYSITSKGILAEERSR